MRLLIATCIIGLAVGTEYSAFHGWIAFSSGLILSSYTRANILEDDKHD